MYDFYQQSQVYWWRQKMGTYLHKAKLKTPDTRTMSWVLYLEEEIDINFTAV